MDVPVKGFNITGSFILNLATSAIIVVIGLATLRSDTFQALHEIAKQEAIIAEQQKTLIDMRIQLQKVSDGLEQLRYQYNEDMNKYIRERPK